MKKNFIVTTLISAFLLCSPNVKAANFTDNQTVDSNKVWTIKFTDEVGLDELTKQGISVTDSKGAAVLGVGLQLGRDNKTVIVTAPEGGYTAGESYILNVGNKAHSSKGKALKNQYKVHFTINSVSDAIRDNTDITSKFTDENFKKAVYSQIGKNSSEPLLYSDVKKVTVLELSQKNIGSLNGIEYFTALTALNCYGNQLTALDVSKNTTLTSLICFRNKLKTLDISKNTALTTLDCSDNQLTNLDLSNNTKLTGLWCRNNQLTTLDVSKHTALTYLVCFNNYLTSLDVSKNTVLTYLNCSSNQLTTLDLSKNTALTYLYCPNNQLKMLYSITDTWPTTDYRLQYTDSTHTTTADSIVITIKKDSDDSNSDIVTFKDINLEQVVRDTINKPIGDVYKSDVEKITELEGVSKNIEDLSGIENLTNLQSLNLLINKISDISPLKGLINLQTINFGGNEISDISPLKGLTNLQTIYLGGNEISDISSLRGLTNLVNLGLNGNQISDASALKGLTNLQKLYLQVNKISDVNPFKELTNLKSLYLVNNPISDDDVQSLINALPKCRVVIDSSDM